MYGRLYGGKIKPLVDQAFKTVCRQYELDLAAGMTENKKPRRLSSWVAVTRAEYAKESDEVKKIVEKAVEEDAKKANELEESLEG